METVLKSTMNGKIKKIYIEAGQQVQGDDLIAELE